MASGGQHVMNYNGTNYTFSEPVSDELICPICHCILEEPQQTNCGHLFCSKCLQSAESSRTSRVTSLWQIDEKSLECPLCRTVSPRGAFYDARTNRQIQNLQVVCTNAPCTWTGSLCELSNHRNGTKCEGCLYEAVTCPNDCQTTNILRKDLADHRKNVCPLREEACKHCRVMLQHCKMADHFMSSCQEYPIQCPNECGKTNIPLKNINAHILKCPESKMTCPYQKIGCSHTFPRKHLQTHMDEGKDHHLQLTLDQVSRLTDVVAHMYLWIDKHSDPNDPILRESFLQSPLLDHTKLHDRPWLKSESVFPSMPWIVKFDNFSQYSEKEWISCTFYTHPVGYKLRLRVTHGADSGVTIILDRLKGTNDDWLPALPSEDSITITLLNQLKNEFHFTLYMQTGQWETGLNFFVPYCELYNDIKKPKFLCDVSLFFLVAMAAPFPKEQQCKEPICEGERAPSLPLCQDKNIPSQSSYAASTKPNHLALAIDRIKISPREMDVIARPMCFLCLGKEPRDTPYGVFMCIIHAQEIHKTQIQRPRASGGSDYRQRYNDDRSERYQRSPSLPSHQNPPGRGADVRGVKTCSVGGCDWPTDPGGDGTMCLDHFYSKRLNASSKKCVFGSCGRATDPASGGKLCFDHFTKALDGKLPGFDLSQITSEQEENLPANKTGKSRPGVGSYGTGGTRSYREVSGNDLPPPITNNPKPTPRKNIPSHSSHAASTKPEHLAPRIDRIEISPREMDILSTQKCFLCLRKEPQDTSYGVFVCIKHAQEIHKTQIQRLRAPGGLDYRQRYDDDRTEPYMRPPSLPSHQNPPLLKLCATPGCSYLHENTNGQKYCDDCLQALLQSPEQNVPKEQQCKEPTCRNKKVPLRMGYCGKCYEDRYLMGGDYY